MIGLVAELAFGVLSLSLFVKTEPGIPSAKESGISVSNTNQTTASTSTEFPKDRGKNVNSPHVDGKSTANLARGLNEAPRAAVSEQVNSLSPFQLQLFNNLLILAIKLSF